MDGTIVDSEVFAKEIWKNAGIECGVDIPEQILNDMIGSSVENTNRMFQDFFGADFDIQNLRHIKNQFELSSYGRGLLKPKLGAVDFLSFVYNVPIPLGLATSTEKFRATRRLEEIGVSEFFSALKYGDEVKEQKPAPEIYLEVAKDLSVSIKDCWVIEDSPSGVAAGIASGALTIWVKDIVDISPELKQHVFSFNSLLTVREELDALLSQS